MSDMYYLITELTDIVMQLFWAVLLSLLYHHFFRLKFHQSSGWMIFLPGAVWLGIKRMADTFVVITYETSVNTVKSLFKLLLIYGSLLLISFLFYQGNRKQLILITALFAAVSEISRFLAFSLSCVWSGIYELCGKRFEQNYPAMSIEEYMRLMEGIGMLQQLVNVLIFSGTLYSTMRYVRKIYKNREMPLHKTEFLFLMLPCTSSFLLCTLLRTIMITTEDTMPRTLYETFPLLIFIVPVLLILCLFSMLYSIKLYQEMLALNEERNRRMVLEKQIVSMEEHARELERVYSGIRSMKHDMKNQLAVLGSLIDQRDDSGTLPDYLEQLSHTLGALDVPFQTGSAVVDSLLSMKYHEVCEKIPGIRFEAEDLIFSKTSLIQPMDLCIILGNALDNAIEACENIAKSGGGEDCFIRLYSRCRNNMLLLTVENSFQGKLNITSGSFFPSTTKSDSETHGIGMHNIRTSAERYQGGVSWQTEKNVFILTVMLNIGGQSDSLPL